MITQASNSDYGLCPDGTLVAKAEFYITEDADLGELTDCASGSMALQLVTGAMWFLRSDGKWHKFGSEEVYPAE